MLIRSVLIGKDVYGAHLISSIAVNDGGRVISVYSYKDEQEAERPGASYVPRVFTLEADTSQDYAEAYAFISGLPEFEEYTDKLDEVLSILTDEQAEQVVDAFPLWEADRNYQAGYRVRFDGFLWKCLQAHRSQEGWEPGAAPSLWSKVGDPGEIPEWVQPTGAHDAYSKGDKVRHDGKVWVSDIDANTYEPGVYGWTEVE